MIVALVLGYYTLRRPPTRRRTAREAPNLFLLLVDIWVCVLIWKGLSWLL